MRLPLLPLTIITDKGYECRLKLIGEDYIMTGYYGSHRLSAHCTSPLRLLTHWIGFVDNNGGFPYKSPLKHRGLLGVFFDPRTKRTITMVQKTILKAEEKTCLELIAEYKATLRAGGPIPAHLMTKMLLKDVQETLAEIQKELSMLEK
jgi:hypothetical protein